MKAVIEFDQRSPQAKQLMKYLKTLPFLKVTENDKVETKSAWETAIAEGAVSVDTFVGELKARIQQWPDDNA